MTAVKQSQLHKEFTGQRMKNRDKKASLFQTASLIRLIQNGLGVMLLLQANLQRLIATQKRKFI